MERENTETKDEAMEPEPTKPKRRRRKNRVIDEESTPKPRRKHLRKEKVSARNMNCTIIVPTARLVPPLPMYIGINVCFWQREMPNI